MQYKLRVVIAFSLILFWFLVLPFPFERTFFTDNFHTLNKTTHWRMFGGYRLIKPYVYPYGNDYPQREVDHDTTFYSSTSYLVIFFAISTALGLASFVVLDLTLLKESVDLE